MAHGQHNAITYLYFCTLGGLSHPKCAKVLHTNGSYSYFTYHLTEPLS